MSRPESGSRANSPTVGMSMCWVQFCRSDWSYQICPNRPVLSTSLDQPVSFDLPFSTHPNLAAGFDPPQSFAVFDPSNSTRSIRASRFDSCHLTAHCGHVSISSPAHLSQETKMDQRLLKRDESASKRLPWYPCIRWKIDQSLQAHLCHKARFTGPSFMGLLCALALRSIPIFA
jgi:hypothetical protein